MPQLVALLAGVGIVGVVIYFLIIGGILIWPIVNILAYLKVLIFPKPIRKKYGTSVEKLSDKSFLEEITDGDLKEIKNLNARAKKYADANKKLRAKFRELGSLTRNKDGSISQRSNKGKEGHRLQNSIASQDASRNIALEKAKDISNKPENAWLEWKSRYARYLGNRDAIIFMIVGFPLFFLTLNLSNMIEANFVELVEMYIYIVFVAPVIDTFDLAFFKDGLTSAFISFEYAQQLNKIFDKHYTLANWATLTLPMPLLTLVVYFISNAHHSEKAKAVRPASAS